MDDIALNNICIALDSLLNPSINNATRQQALHLCESYKENPNCAEIGFYLANISAVSPNVRYYGLQLVKHRVRMHWTSMSSDEQLAIKSSILNLITQCACDEPNFIKFLMASILNEIVKHVWPQQWDNMQNEIIANISDRKNLASVEIVVTMFLNLAEDVVLYQNVATKSRARDLRQALSLAAPEIISFFLTILKQQSKQSNDSNEVGLHKQLAHITLNALSGYVEWVNISVLFLEDGILFDTLLHLCKCEPLQVLAGECLLAAVSRKGPVEDRKLLLSLTNDLYVDKYTSAIEFTSQMEGFNQSKFQFLLVVGKIIATLTSILIGLWEDKEKHVEGCLTELASHKKFLRTLFFLSSHESKVVAQTVIQSWTNLLRHKEIRKDNTLLQVVPLLIDLIKTRIYKDFDKKTVFTPFEEINFNGSDEREAVLKAFRGNIVELLRFCTCALPLKVMQACFEYTQKELVAHQASVDNTHIHLDAMSAFLETVTSSVIRAAEERNEKQLLPVVLSENLMHTFLSQKTEDLAAMRIYFSCASSLCPLVALSLDPRCHFQFLIESIFKILDETSADVTNSSVSIIRRQACATMVRISKTYPKILVSLMNHLKDLISERLVKTSCSLSPFEKVAMLESMILISSEWKDISRQSQLIGEVMETTNQVAQSSAFISAMESPRAFSKAIGLDIVPPDVIEGEDLPSSKLRSDIYYYIALTLAVLNRSQPSTINDASDTFIESPCHPHLGTAFEHMLILVNLITSMWSPTIRETVHFQNCKALQIKGCEKRSLICQNAEFSADKSSSDEKVKLHWERLQNFLILCLDNCYQLIGLAGKVLGPSFYNVPQLYQIIIDKIFSNVEHLPTIRLKSLLRHFLTPFIKSCPVERTNSLISPLLQKYCHFMMEKIQPLWDNYAKKEYERLQGGNSDNMNDDEEREEEEILEEQLLRLITREYFDLLVTVCINKRPPNSKVSTENGSYNVDVEMKPADGGEIVQMTTLGVAIANSICCENILSSALISLSWHDTTTCYKSSQLLWPLLKLLIHHHSQIFSDDVVQFVVRTILQGLSRHGQHDGCDAQLSSLALMVIQHLLQDHVHAISAVLNSAIPTDSREIAKRFLSEFHLLNDKKRKLLFKQLVGRIIECHVGQQYKETPRMNDFAPLIHHRKKIDEIVPVDYSGLANLFQPPS